MVFEYYAQPAAPPRPRGQATGQSLAREDAGAPCGRHWLDYLFKDHKSRARINRRCRDWAA